MSLRRLQPALKHVMDHSVTILPFQEWKELVHHSGDPTRIEVAPKELSGILSSASKVATAGSGIFNPDPGIDIVRHDPGDAPSVYNIDHYTVIENLSSHEQYSDALTIANVEDSEELRRSLRENVFIVGPYKLDNHHWVTGIPDHIANARARSDD